jgi:hypothetical protein
MIYLLDKLTSYRHFLSIQNTAYFPDGMNTDVFLVINTESIMSYTKPVDNIVKPAGDRGGYVLAIEANFNPNTTDPRAFEYPGYIGQVHILGSLLWHDFYALLASRAQELKHFWPFAMGHPMKVYVGPTVASQNYAWEQEHQMRQAMTTGFFQFLKKKEDEGTL